MGTITYASQFKPGQIVTGAAIDTQFTAVTSAYSSLTADNFRRFSGINNVNKASPYSVVIGGMNIPSLTFTDADTAQYYSLFSYPHSQNADPATTNAAIDPGTVPLVEPFKIKSAQVSWDTVTGAGESASDSIRALVVYAKAGAKNAGYGLAGGYAGGAIGTVGDNTISRVTYTVTDAIACHFYLYIAAYSASAGDRVVTNLSAWAVLEVPHV